MTESANRIGMTLLRVGAVVVALGVGAFLVHKAHTDANEPEAQPKQTPTPTPGETITDKEAFMRSSKSLSFDETSPPPPEPTQKEPVFLPSSKSGIVAPPKEPKKKPAFLPSSKSMPPPVEQKNDG